MKYILINKATAQAEVFATEEQAHEFIRNLNYAELLIKPCIEDTDNAELTLYPNAEKSRYSFVAEYNADLLNTDLIETELPIKITFA